MILDAHSYLGKDIIHDREYTEEQILKVMTEQGVDKTLIEPISNPINLDKIRTTHNDLNELIEKSNGQIYGLCSFSPQLGLSKYKDEINNYIKKGFVGIVVNPVLHVWNPLSKVGKIPFVVAEEMDVPLMVSTGEGLPFSLPTNFYYLCKDFSSVKVVLLHAGALMLGKEAWLVASDLPNVYLETGRGGNMREIKHFIRSLGPDRVLFGSDGTDEMAHAIWMYRNAGLTEDELRWTMGLTAQKLFKLNN